MPKQKNKMITIWYKKKKKKKKSYNFLKWHLYIKILIMLIDTVVSINKYTLHWGRNEK